MIRRALALTSFAVAAWVAPSSASAWSCAQPGCATWCEMPHYELGRLSSDLESFGAGTTETETRRAMEDWTRVSCGGLLSTFDGATGRAATSGDGFSVVEYVDQNWPHGDAIIALTTQVMSNGCIVEGDIELNGENYDFVTRPGFQNEINGYSAVLHESGHFYGLGHSAMTDAAMYYRYGSGKLEITYDDEQGLCYLYPGSDPPPDCAVTGCPSGQTCSAGVCVDAPRPACASDTDCIRIQRCNLATGRCENRPPATSDLGAACTADAECSSNLCVVGPSGKFCSETCDALDPGSCLAGYHCTGRALGDCAVGLCMPGGAGSGSFGSACRADTDCASLYCGGGRCTVPCDRSEANPCPAGDACHPSDILGCGLCAPPLAMGFACQDASECESDLCFDPELDGAGFCTAVCTSDDACDPNFRCRSVGAQSICLPDGSLTGGACRLAPGGAPSAFSGVVVLAVATALFRRRRLSS